MADMLPTDWLHGAIGAKFVNVISGIAGGLARGLVSPGFSLSQRISSAVVGGLTAGYGTPAVMPIVRKWLDLWSYPTGDIEGSVGFCLGLVGMTICDALIRWAKRWRDGPPPSLPPGRPGGATS